MRRERRPLAGTLVLGPRAGRLRTDLLRTNRIEAGQVALADSQSTIDNKIFPVSVVFQFLHNHNISQSRSLPR